MLQRFTGGAKKEALDKLNALVDEINSLAGLRGDPYITVSRGPGGTAVGLNIQAVVARVPKMAAADNDVVAVTAATTTNQALTGVSTLDGVTLADGDWVFLQNQTTAADNGVYSFDASTGDLNFVSQSYGVLVTDGTANGQTLWALSEVTDNKYNQVGGNQKLYVISVQANYLTCNTKADGSGTTYYVAKPTRLRSSDTAARAVAGQTYTVTKSGFTTGVASGDAQTCTATRSSDSGTDTLEVVEPYLAGDEICALPFPTGILDGSRNPINLLDANVDARHWAVKSSA